MADQMWLTRRRALAALGGFATAAAAGALVTGDGNAAWSPQEEVAGAMAVTTGYAPDGLAGRTTAFALRDVTLLDSPFRQNQARNTAYLLFLDPDRMLRPFRLNYGVPTTAQPCGGWEDPQSQVRGHTTGHLLSALAITYANTGSAEALERGQYLVAQLAMLQAKAKAAGFNPGYLSAFPESFFDILEAGKSVWSPYYMIHKYLAGLIDQYQLAGDDAALQVATRLGDWVAWRTARLPYTQMQMVLQTEFGGMPEALANLYAITGVERYLAAAQRFYHAEILDPLAAGIDPLAGVHANMTVPKIVACVRMWEELGSSALASKYHDIAVNFWNMVTQHHSYVNGGASNYEHFQAPDAVATQLSNFTCENCVGYNMLKLTRLLYFHQPRRVDLIDYYERALFNQMLGEQDPTSPHGFNCYYTGLSPGAFKRQPLNYFPSGDPNVYATDYDTFTCDNATGMETQAKFADTIYARDSQGLYVNLFIPSEVRLADLGLHLRQETGFPDKPQILITTVAGAAVISLRVRVPSWTSGKPLVKLNGSVVGDLRDAVPGGWVTIQRLWQAGDKLEVTLPMAVAFDRAPDQPRVQAVTYGPVVLSGVYATDPGPALPTLDVTSVQRTNAAPMTFSANADGKPVTLVPVARAAHQYYTVYWQT
ncbi:MAG: glycoside hydrolase family 127 protein [Streptosporangiaceae bacterium]|nr:glycoside hydrolase family 127 protein [Streptosporangiaceae bacterium]